jgi:hypothetical protein
MVARLVWAVLALPFLVAGFVFLEAAFWRFLLLHLAEVPATLLAGGANILLGAVLVLPALLRPADDRVAREAVQLRREAVAGIESRLRIGSAAVGLMQAFLLLRRRTPRR